MSDEQDPDGVYKVWRVPHATVSWTAEDCFNLFRMESCPPSILADFLQQHEVRIKERAIAAVADYLKDAWYVYCWNRGIDRQHAGVTQPKGDSP